MKKLPPEISALQFRRYQNEPLWVTEIRGEPRSFVVQRLYVTRFSPDTEIISLEQGNFNFLGNSTSHLPAHLFADVKRCALRFAFLVSPHHRLTLRAATTEPEELEAFALVRYLERDEQQVLQR